MSFDNQLTEIVLEGGPCSGKSSSLAVLSAKLADWGFRPILVPELATQLFAEGGLSDIGQIVSRDPAHFAAIEAVMLDMMVSRRVQYQKLAQTFIARGEKVVLIYDRAEADVAAYVGREKFIEMCRAAKIAYPAIRDDYEAVLFLITAAFGAEEAYTRANNLARRESLEEARATDLRTRLAWQGHPHLIVIDNSTDFEGKLARVLAATARVLGIPEPLEIERKFLLAQIPSPAVLTALEAVPVEIEQTYLSSETPALERRVRRRGPVGAAMYYYTEKQRINRTTRSEREEKISRKQYRLLLTQADPAKISIRKVRHHFIYEGAYFELDLYQQPGKLATLEIELISADAPISLPVILGPLREVTGEVAFSNSELARKKV